MAGREREGLVLDDIQALPLRDRVDGGVIPVNEEYVSLSAAMEPVRSAIHLDY